MKVYITNTPEFSSDKVDEVVALLKRIPGELEFEKGKFLTQAKYKRINKIFEDFNGIERFSFDEYFDFVQGYREYREEINAEDFVIVITSIRHDQNWFSGFKKKDIFVRSGEWDIISNVDSKFGIAHQCVENIFQSLCDLDIMNYKSEPNIHMEAIGCINDFCGYKPDILKKLKLADICESCYNRYKQNGGSDVILAHIVSIIEKIRNEFVISRKFTSELNLDIVKVDEKGKIFIGNRFIKLDLLPRVVYISFLNHLDGIQSHMLCEKKNMFNETYKEMKTDPDPEVVDKAIDKMCCKKTRITDANYKQTPTFGIYKSRIKEALVKKLGETLANYYSVILVQDEYHQNLYKINLPIEKLHKDGKFIK